MLDLALRLGDQRSRADAAGVWALLDTEPGMAEVVIDEQAAEFAQQIGSGSDESRVGKFGQLFGRHARLVLTESNAGSVVAPTVQDCLCFTFQRDSLAVPSVTAHPPSPWSRSVRHMDLLSRPHIVPRNGNSAQ